MKGIAVLLLAALIGSSLYLVRTSYEARRLFAQLDRALVEQKTLDTEYKRLDAERQAQATHLRVEKTAREKLQMRTATPAVTQYVNDAAPAATSPAPAPPACAASTTPPARCWPARRRPGVRASSWRWSGWPFWG